MHIDESRRAEWVRSAVERFVGPLTRYAQVITGDLEQARDVVQDTFVRLCDEKPERIDAHLAQWLFTVCRNRALDVQRKQSRMKPLSEADINSQVSPDLSPAAQAERCETNGEVTNLLARLPRNQQEVIRLKFQNGLSYREISEITQLSVRPVGFLLPTALHPLRQQMKSEPAKKIP